MTSKIVALSVVFIALSSTTTKALAGFEFSAKSSTPQQASSENIDAAIFDNNSYDAQMPIVSAPSVTAMPLDDMHTNEMYTTHAPAKNEAIDTQGLLQAVENDRFVTMTPEGSERVVKNVQNSGGRLVINPYPLQESASHSSSAGAPLEQAMMEQGGYLRPVVTAGKNQVGMMERSQRGSSRNDFNKLENAQNVSADETHVDAMVLTPINIAPSVSLPSPPQMNNPQPSTGNYQEAVGFGKELPLALALSQIVPPDFSYAFGESVNTGETVSWQGGKPWNMVLDDMLAPAGLMAVINNNQVFIRSRNS